MREGGREEGGRKGGREGVPHVDFYILTFHSQLSCINYFRQDVLVSYDACTYWNNIACTLPCQIMSARHCSSAFMTKRTDLEQPVSMAWIVTGESRACTSK